MKPIKCLQKVDYISNIISNKESAMEWKAINEISNRKNCSRSKLKASSSEE